MTIYTININDNDNVLDYTAIKYGINHIIRDILAKYYINASIDINDKNLCQCHLKNMIAQRDIMIKDNMINVVLKNSPVIVLSYKDDNSTIEKCSTINEVEVKLNTSLYYIGMFRQAKGLRDSIKHSAIKILNYENSKIESLIMDDN